MRVPASSRGPAGAGAPRLGEEVADLDPQRADDRRQLAAGEAAKQDAAVVRRGDAQARASIFVGGAPGHPARVCLRHALQPRQDFLDRHGPSGGLSPVSVPGLAANRGQIGARHPPEIAVLGGPRPRCTRCPRFRGEGGHPRDHSLSGGSSPAIGHPARTAPGCRRPSLRPLRRTPSNRARSRDRRGSARVACRACRPRARAPLRRAGGRRRSLRAARCPTRGGTAPVAFVDAVDVREIARPARVRAAFDENVERRRSAPPAHQDGIDVHGILRGLRACAVGRRERGGDLGAIRPSQRPQRRPSSRGTGSGRLHRQATIHAARNVLASRHRADD